MPTNRDIEKFPDLSNIHRIGCSNDPKYEDWWTGRSVFPLPGTSSEVVRHALTASKGKPSRSKAEAKREAKASQFKGTDTVCQESVPSMEKPVNIMTYDMRDFLISCVDRYCELAKVSRQSLATVPTPFSENRVAKPLEENEPVGRLQPIASKVLMKVLCVRGWLGGISSEPHRASHLGSPDGVGILMLLFTGLSAASTHHWT